METIEQKPTSEAETFQEHKALRAAPPVEATPAPAKVEPTEEKKPASETQEVKTAEKSDASETSESQEDKKARRDRSAEGRIAELHARIKRTEEDRDDYHKKWEAANQAPKPVAAVEAKPTTDDTEPKLADFLSKAKSYEEGQEAYFKAALAYDRKQQAHEFEKLDRERKGKQLLDDRNTKINKARAAHDDFDAVTHGDTKTGTGLILTPAMVQFLDDDPDAGEVVYYLGKNPDEYAAIKALPPAKQIGKLDRIAEKLTAPPEKTITTTPVSRAPAPPRTVTGTEPPANKGTAEAANFREHKALRRAQGVH